MAAPPLVACPACARHVRVSESACPFCQTAFGAPLRARTPGKAPVVGLSRAALFALGTGTMALAPACSSSGAGAVQDGGSQMEDGPVPQPVYGAPVVDSGAGDGSMMGEPAYGGPPTKLDSGAADADAGAEIDAEMLVDAAYGAPPGDH